MKIIAVEIYVSLSHIYVRLLCFLVLNYLPSFSIASYCFRRPVKAAVAAAAEHLAGLLPLHLVYSHAHETAIEVCRLLFYRASNIKQSIFTLSIYGIACL